MKRVLTRAMVQLVLLLAAASTVASTKAEAYYEQWCIDQATACMQMCGATVTYQLQYMECVQYQLPPNQWQCSPTGWRGHYEWGWSSGIENFECDEVSETFWCQCAY